MSWYDLEIFQLKDSSYYPILLMNRSNDNAGFDLYASENTIIDPSGMIPFGISARLIKVDLFESSEYVKTDSHFLLIPRSSIYKSGLMMANSVGVIDKSYRGELKAPVIAMKGSYEVTKGERLFQIVAPDMGWIRNVRLVDSLPVTARGADGFGSTGK
jgi:deoxyuridine 5'-triphosphate nucleotidohydrolase